MDIEYVRFIEWNDGHIQGKNFKHKVDYDLRIKEIE